MYSRHSYYSKDFPLPEKCPYCLITDPQHEIVFDRELVLFSRNPEHQGSLKHSGIIIPKAHRSTVFDLSSEEITATFELLGYVKNWMDKEFNPQGYNIGWNCCPVGGQLVMHAHMHVIPRFSQEPLAGQGIRTLIKSDRNKW